MRDAASTAEVPSSSEALLSAPDRTARRLDAKDPSLPDRVRCAVAARLRLLRRRSGLSMADVALLARTYRPIVGRVERAVHTASLETATRIAEANGGGLRDVLEAIDEALGLGGAQP
jgi:hypothetical protein